MRCSTWLVLSLFALAFAAGWVGGARHARTAAPTPGILHSALVSRPTPASPTAAVPSPASSRADFEMQWSRASSRRGLAAGEHEMAALLEDYARQNPSRAMELATSEQNLRLRDQLRHAVLRGWAATAPKDALAYVMRLPDMDNSANVQAVLTGAAEHPEEAVKLGRQLIAGSPELAGEFGASLISALGAAGAFDAAARFASADTSPNRAGWLNQAFGLWAAHAPAEALAAASQLADTAARQDAVHGVISGWAEANPKTLADYGLSLPPGDDRTFALMQALPRWVATDPAAAAEWLNQAGSDPGIDAGILAIATLPALVHGRPDVAIEWASSITDPAARDGALQNLAERWAREDPAAFAKFMAANSRLRAEDRASLARGAENLAGPSGKRG